MGGYWLFITYLCLWPLGRCEGYLLVNPLIACAETPLMILVSWIGVMGATLVFCMVSAFYAHLTMPTGCMIFFCVLIIMGTSGFFKQLGNAGDSVEHPSALNIITKPIIAGDDRAAVCRLVCEYIAHEHVQQIDLRGIVFPESCFYPWQVCADSLLANYLPSTICACDYIIGSFYDEQGLYRNSCYWLIDGVLQKRFDKRHAMPLIERLPYWFKNAELSKLFFATMPEIVPSSNERPLMRLGTQFYVPYICSELFFNRLPDDIYPKVPIVALINDRWAQPYLQHLMYYGAIVQAYAWHRAILYCSYTRFRCITPRAIELLSFFSFSY